MSTSLLWLLAGAALAAPPSAERARDALGPSPAYVVERAGTPAAAPWWSGFEDPALDALLTEALRENPSVLVARANAAVADATRGTARSALLPRLSFDASASASPTDALGFQFGGLSGPSTVDVLVGMETLQDVDGDGIPDVALDPAYVAVDVPQTDTADLTWNGSAQLNASWALDLWGANLQTFQASRHQARAAAGDAAAARLSTATLVAGAWYDLVHAQARLALVTDQVETNRTLLELVQLRYEGGAATGLELLQQQQQLAATEALLPAASFGVRRGLLRLAVLLGRPPAALLEGFTPADRFPALPPAPPTGTPADLIANRPDLSSAAARVDAAFYSRRSADRAFLPSLGISANAGWQYFRQDELKSTDIWGIGAQASVPLFNGGRLYSGAKSARASEEAAVRTLENAVRTAVQEVDDALLFEDQAAAELDARGRQVAAARRAHDDARDRYLEGLIDLTTMLQTLTALQNAELSLLQSQRTAISARIALHDALGGAWTRTEVTR